MSDDLIIAPSREPQRLQSYFYDKQIRRFLLQFTRMFSNFQINIGSEKEPTLITIPIKYATTSRMVAEIIAGGSNNTFACAPLFSFYISGLTYDRKNLQDPNYVDRKLVRQRKWNKERQVYDETQGNAFNVERHMPAPYILELTLDFWSSNIEMKLQTLEQILWIFNPSLEIQSTDNYLDWTSLSTVEIEPAIQWSSRGIPVNSGMDTDMDITTMKFTLPIWISPPARVSKGGIIHKIIANIYDDEGDMINAIQNDDILLGTRQKITPHGYQVLLIDNELQLLRQSNPVNVHNSQLGEIPEQDSNVMWKPVLSEYGTITEGISQIRLEGSEDIGTRGSEIVGTIEYHPTNDNILIFTVDPDTLPVNTLMPVDAIINPTRSGPPVSNTGTRYLLTDDIGNIDDSGVAIEWAPSGNELVAKMNDIIEFDGTDWIVAWEANPEQVEFITNLTTKIQYKWNFTQWIRSYAGIYNGGQWAAVI